jgi:hypothetical protein
MTYKAALGDFGDIYQSYTENDFDQKVMPYFMFFINLITLFFMIALLNVLIAIVGQTYDEVMELREQNTLLEKATVISDIFALITICKKNINVLRQMSLLCISMKDSNKTEHSSSKGLKDLNDEIIKVNKQMEMLKNETKRMVSQREKEKEEKDEEGEEEGDDEIEKEASESEPEND